MSAPLLLISRGRSRVVRAGFRLGPEYKKYRKAVAAASRFTDLLIFLERALDQPDQYASAASDFAPVADYARQFLNTTRAYLQQPHDSPEWAQGQRALRLMERLLADTRRPRGRRKAGPLAPEWFEAVRSCYGWWEAVVTPLWHAAGRDRTRLASAIEQASSGRWPWAEAHRQALKLMCRRRSLRPSRVIEQIAAWELGLSLEQVRQVRHPSVEVVHA